MPKYMLIMRPQAGAALFSGELPFEEIINQVGAFNEQLVNAGVLVAGEGLADAATGVVVDCTGETPLVTDGPYGEVHELFNGFWIVEVASREEAIEWAKKAPLGAGAKLEVRRITDESDFADFADFADNEFVQKEKEWRAQGL